MKNQKDEVLFNSFSGKLENSSVIRDLNLKMLEVFRKEDCSMIENKLCDQAAKVISNTGIINSEIAEKVNNIQYNYLKALESINLGDSIIESFIPLINIQIKALQQLSQSSQTDMIGNLTRAVTSVRYKEVVDIINQTLEKDNILAPDISFIKTSELMRLLKDDLVYPKGFKTSIKDLNIVTANDMASNMTLEYDTKSNKFISNKNSIDSKGLNVIYSCKNIFNEKEEIFTESELIDFSSFLSDRITFGHDNPTGKKIYNLLERLRNTGEKTIGFDKGEYYHCRLRCSDGMPFTFDEMLKAPNGIPGPGRFNFAGKAYYYFADTSSGAEKEANNHRKDNKIPQVQRIIPIKEADFLDLSGTLTGGKTFLRYLRFSLTDYNSNMPREYLIPCYVSDCCKDLGFDGIKYRGSSEYNNYVLWQDGYFSNGGVVK